LLDRRPPGAIDVEPVAAGRYRHGDAHRRRDVPDDANRVYGIRSFVEKGDILKIKNISRGNIFHRRSTSWRTRRAAARTSAS
jgi:hypothetical protein